MLRFFAFGCALADITGTLASFGTDCDYLGLGGWLALNAALLVLPLSARAVEPLLSAWTRVPGNDEFARAALAPAVAPAAVAEPPPCESACPLT